MQTTTPLLTTDPIQEMDHLRNVISQESFSVDGITRSLQSLIPSLQKHFQGFMRGDTVLGFMKSDTGLQLKGNEREFVKMLDGQMYLNLSVFLAFVPEGLQVSYAEYLTVLRDAAQHCHNNTQKILNDYSVYLAQIITNRQLKLTTMPLDATYAKMEKTRTELVTRMAKCFKPGSSKAEVTYADVVSRNNEWATVFDLVHQVDHIINTIRRDDLQKKAEECNNQLNTIIKQIRNHEFEGAGPEVVNNLSNGAYQAGAELEFFATVYFRGVTINQAVGDTMQHVTTILKKN